MWMRDILQLTNEVMSILSKGDENHLYFLINMQQEKSVV